MIDKWHRFPDRLSPDFSAISAVFSLAFSKYRWVLPVNYDRRYDAVARLIALPGRGKVLSMPGSESDWCRGTRHRSELIAEALLPVTNRRLTPQNVILAPADGKRERIEPILDELGQPPVVLFPGGGDHREVSPDPRRWPAWNFIRLSDLLGEAGAGPLVLQGSIEETKLVAEIAAGCCADVTDLSGRFDLMELAAFLSRCRLVIAVDSGPIQLAAAVGCATLMLSGPVAPETSNPEGKNHEFLNGKEDCMPCFPDPVQAECRTGYSLCLSGLTPEIVKSRVLKMIEG